MKPMVSINQGKVDLNFHPGQMRAWDSTKRFIFILAGTQGGKTSFGPWWLGREIQRTGGGDHLAVTANFDLFKLKMLPELTKAFIDILGIGKYWAQMKVIEIMDPDTGKFWAKGADDEMYGRIILRSASAGGGDVGVRGLESASAKSAWLDECGLDDFTITAWEAILRRLSLSQGRVLGTTTLYNFGWLRSEIYQPWAQGSNDIEVVQFDSIENPMFPVAEYERARATLPSWKFNMVYRGVFDRPAGQIYTDFDDERHVVKEAEIKPSSPVVVGIDPGAVNTATTWLGLDRDGRWVVYDESLDGNMTTQQHANKALAKASGHADIKYFGGAASEKQFRWDWQHAGIPVMAPPVSDVEAGIDRVIALLKSDKLVVLEKCVGIRKQFSEYSRELDERGQPTEKIKDKEKYHYLDALRYAVSGIPRANSGVHMVSFNRKW